MSFDVAPAPVGSRRSRGPIVAVAILAIGIVSLAVVTAGPPPSTRVATEAGVSGRVEAAARAAAPPGATGADRASRVAQASTAPPHTVPLRLPARIDCHTVDAATCDRLARATMEILSPAGLRVSAIDAWASMVCGDALDCPPARLHGALLLGSTAVAFEARGTRAWVNVIEPIPAPGHEWEPPQPEAWIVRWLP